MEVRQGIAPYNPQTNLCRLVKFEFEFKSKNKMAIYHFSVKNISRSAGRSSVACSAYRSGEKLIDERQGKEQDYTKKTGVEFTKIYAPENTNPELLDRNQLWNTVEKVERRKDANLAREFEIAFPHELNKEQRERMLNDLCQELVKRHGVIVDAAIHAPHTKSGSDERNYHAHIMFTGRQIDLETGDFAKKRNRDFNKENSSQTVNQWRETFADITNQNLARAGYLTEVDHRSYADQDNGLQPSIHEGSKVTQLRRQGIDTEISLKNDLIKQQNAENQRLPEILKGLEQEIRLTESQIDKYKLDMSLETIKKLSITMETPKQVETPKPQEKPLERKIEPSKSIEKPNLSATQQFRLLMDQLAQQKQQKVIDKLRSEAKGLKADYAEQTELSKKPEPMFFGKSKWQQEQMEIRGKLNSIRKMFDTKKNQADILASQKPYTSHEEYKAVAEKNPTLYQEMLKEEQQREAQAKLKSQNQELVKGNKNQGKDKENER